MNGRLILVRKICGQTWKCKHIVSVWTRIIDGELHTFLFLCHFGYSQRVNLVHKTKHEIIIVSEETTIKSKPKQVNQLNKINQTQTGSTGSDRLANQNRYTKEKRATNLAEYLTETSPKNFSNSLETRLKISEEHSLLSDIPK